MIFIVKDYLFEKNELFILIFDNFFVGVKPFTIGKLCMKFDQLLIIKNVM